MKRSELQQRYWGMRAPVTPLGARNLVLQYQRGTYTVRRKYGKASTPQTATLIVINTRQLAVQATLLVPAYKWRMIGRHKVSPRFSLIRLGFGGDFTLR